MADVFEDDVFIVIPWMKIIVLWFQWIYYSLAHNTSALVRVLVPYQTGDKPIVYKIASLKRKLRVRL